jgi:hypothetical protein
MIRVVIDSGGMSPLLVLRPHTTSSTNLFRIIQKVTERIDQNIMSGEKGEQEWQTMWGAEVKVINPGNLMPDDMLKSCITTTQKVRRRFISEKL